MAITHLKVSTNPDSGAATLIQPSDWNASHSAAEIADVTGLTDALAAKMPLAGGTLTGQILSTKANGTTAPRVKITNQHATLTYAESAIHLINSAGGLGFAVENKSTGWGIGLINEGGGVGLQVDNSGAGNGVFIRDKADGTTTGKPFQIHHWSTTATTYGSEIYNKKGAAGAFVIHQYSQLANSSAFWIDNCGDQPAIRVWNTESATEASGQFGSGKFLEFKACPSTGQALAEVFYVSGEGAPCMIPKAAAPSTLADGMIWVHGSGADMHVYARLNGATKELAVVF